MNLHAPLPVSTVEVWKCLHTGRLVDPVVPNVTTSRRDDIRLPTPRGDAHLATLKYVDTVRKLPRLCSYFVPQLHSLAQTSSLTVGTLQTAGTRNEGSSHYAVVSIQCAISVPGLLRLFPQEMYLQRFQNTGLNFVRIPSLPPQEKGGSF